MKTYVRYVTLHFRDLRSAASSRYRNRAEITVLMGEKKNSLSLGVNVFSTKVLIGDTIFYVS